MRLFRMGVIWGVVYFVTLIPFALLFLMTCLEGMFAGSLSPLVSPYNLQGLEASLVPFFITVFVAAIVQQLRDQKASPPRRPLLGVPLPAWVAVWVAALTVLVASREPETPMSEEQKRELAASGCINYPRDAIDPLTRNYRVLVYDRSCKTAPKHTVNVSVQESSTPVGPGNALVVEAEDGSEAGAQKLGVFAHVAPARGELMIVYGARARVLAHNTSIYGLSVSIEPDSFPKAIGTAATDQPR